jgi:hypothetical protein
MVLNPSQYSLQGLLPQFPGLQGAGSPQMNPGLFGQPGANGSATPFGQESGQAGLSQQYPFGGQTNSFPHNPFAQPYTQNQFAQSPFATAAQAGAHHPTQHIITALGQLAQQFAVHGAMTQQIGIALHQLAQQLAAQSLQTQSYAGGQGGYGGFNPQAQAWGANRQQTIQ